MKSLSKIVGLVVLVLLLGSATPPMESLHGSRKDRSSEELKLYTEALSALIIRSDTAQTQQLTDKVLAIDSMHTPSIILQARIAKTPIGRWQLYERALRSDPKNAFAREQAAEAALRANQQKRAIELFGTMADTTSNLEIIYRLAMIHTLSGSFDKSLALLDTLDVRFGYSEATSKMRQHIFKSQGLPEKAEQEALRLFNESPYDAHNTADLASFYEDRAEYEKALELYDKAIALDSSDVDFHLGRLRMLERLKRTNEMLMTWFDIIAFPQIDLPHKISVTRDFTSSLEFYRHNLPLIDAIISRLYSLYGSNSDVLTLYAQHKWRTKEPEKVAAAFKKALAESNPPKMDMLGEVISMEVAFERPDSVLHYAKIGAKHYPDEMRFHHATMFALSQKKEYQQGVEYCKSVLDSRKYDKQQQSEFWQLIGDSYYQMGNNKESYAAYRKAIKCNPKNATALNNYAYHLACAKLSLPKALEMAQQAVAIDPQNSTFLDTLAWVHFVMGNLDEAKRVQQSALSFDGNKNGEIALHYGDILAAMGNTFLAHTYWRKALELGGVTAEEVERRLKN